MMTEYETYQDGIGVTTLSTEKGTIDNIREDSPVSISGVALPENVIIEGGQGVEHFYSPEKAQRAAEVLQRQVEDDDTVVHLVKNFHDIEGAASADDIIGEVTGAGYQQGVGVVFEAETVDEETAKKIDLGYLQISPSVARSLGEFDETMQARNVDSVAGFRDIAVVGNGQQGVDVEVGPNPAIEAMSKQIEVDTLQDTKSVAGVSFQGTREGKLDESEIDENFGDHALYGEGENKEDYSYWVVDAEGYLRKGNVESAHSLGCRGQCPSEETHDEKLMNLADEFDDPPEFAQETETMSLDDAKETIAEEYDIDPDTLEDRLTDSEPDEDTVILVED